MYFILLGCYGNGNSQILIGGCDSADLVCLHGVRYTNHVRLSLSVCPTHMHICMCAHRYVRMCAQMPLSRKSTAI
jgi:hypothetical protein